MSIKQKPTHSKNFTVHVLQFRRDAGNAACLGKKVLWRASRLLFLLQLYQMCVCFLRASPLFYNFITFQSEDISNAGRFMLLYVSYFVIVRKLFYSFAKSGIKIPQHRYAMCCSSSRDFVRGTVIHGCELHTHDGNFVHPTFPNLCPFNQPIRISYI